jgi:hypothetical protein
MNRRDLLRFAGGLLGSTMFQHACKELFAEERSNDSRHEIVGMYIHKAWPYHRPYAARAWTFEDWRGYAEGCKELGFNTLIIWPLIETMPSPLTESDRADLQLMAKVIDTLHDLDMRAYVTLLPNVIVDNAVATNYSYERRPYFHALTFANPGDPKAINKMIRWREELLRPLAKIDGCVIIDSDTGGYPGSTNEQFIELLIQHRKMFDRLRPGIELVYWMHVGWEAYCRYYATGRFEWGSPAETEDVLRRLKKANPEPWGISVHSIDPPPTEDFKIATKLGLDSKAVSFNYGAIEGEPTFPLTNFGGNRAWRAGRAAAPRGVVGNAQSHCLQLPNTFAFACGALGRTVSDNEYVELANNLISGHGSVVVDAWRALSGNSHKEVREVAAKVEIAARGSLQPGRLRGLIFGDAVRFMDDLNMQLEYRAAYLEFFAASEDRINAEAFRKFIVKAEAWQHRTGYECLWYDQELNKMLRKLRSPAIDQLIREADYTLPPQVSGATPFERVIAFDRLWDTYTVRMLAAMKSAALKL